MAHVELRILVADTGLAIAKIRDAFTSPSLRVSDASAYEEALRQYEELQPQVVIVGYHFDEMRPYRLIREIREGSTDVSIVLVRVLPLHTAMIDEAAIRATYSALGVNHFVLAEGDAKPALATVLADCLRERGWKAGNGRGDWI